MLFYSPRSVTRLNSGWLTAEAALLSKSHAHRDDFGVVDEQQCNRCAANRA